MKQFRFVLRLITAIVIGIPTLWILFFAFTLFGISIIMIIGSFIGIIFSWMLGSKEGIYECKDCIRDMSWTLIAPFLFWYEFIKGNNPFKELGI